MIATETHTTSIAPASLLVQQELAEDRQFHPNLGGITRGGMANHYPMTVLSLRGLGATDEEVLRFKQSWPRHRARFTELGLVELPEVTTANWAKYLGQSGQVLSFRRVFETFLSQTDPDQVIAQVLDVLKNGLPMGLFHPLIRLSFARLQGDTGMIADALAYMAIRFVDLYGSELRAMPSGISPAAVWRGLSQAGLAVKAPGGSIRICEQLCADPHLQKELAGLDGADPGQQQALCRLALRLYLFAPALSTLHAVTAAQALADLTEHGLQAGLSAANYADLWQRYGIWLTGLYLEKGAPAQLPELDSLAAEALKETSWESLAVQARAIPEVHLIKMTFSCQWLDQHQGSDGLYKQAVVNMLHEKSAHPRQGRGLTPTAL